MVSCILTSLDYKMKNAFFLLIVFVIGIMASCKNSDNKQASVENLKSKAAETLGDDVSCTNNDNGAYSLCQISKTMQSKLKSLGW